MKDVLAPDKNILALCTGIGLVSLLVWNLKDTHFLRYTQEALCLFCPVFDCQLTYET